MKPNKLDIKNDTYHVVALTITRTEGSLNLYRDHTRLSNGYMIKSSWSDARFKIKTSLCELGQLSKM